MIKLIWNAFSNASFPPTPLKRTCTLYQRRFHHLTLSCDAAEDAWLAHAIVDIY
jgi:hypothetical protein